jgi:hypothetical protein
MSREAMRPVPRGSLASCPPSRGDLRQPPSVLTRGSPFARILLKPCGESCFPPPGISPQSHAVWQVVRRQALTLIPVFAHIP